MDSKLTIALFDDGIMSALFRIGFIGTKPFLYRDIYLWVNAQVETRSISKTRAVLEAEIKFEVGRTTVWNALKCFD